MTRDFLTNSFVNPCLMLTVTLSIGLTLVISRIFKSSPRGHIFYHFSIFITFIIYIRTSFYY
ncbi:hypothetical protein GLOIN_2v1695948 [Rhizophagus irregularis DAOM 181602=DAOM 197198]|uniref:Uncharacterized protein n=1 Tax=Rhizophagus irregularis (strain DAOM 181602 / DAOM 197198 / MUCL 43194) TaxID=747089 RepID=A0A2P4PAS1_RHIID|nr:hypothetical protein GLOIN_2v1695948 [Rhizophagus irregularis DAOM 181602=DAOM 197198]POG62478.1 hypothetical protein GLOIN_2v1695948 [Rhizophagus irregularis DAOM 181602=DAOM 197198]|eukprot:XP_025169344.1 hypothetical protein GLOIN_2v1695948 [Rhizophagus irregularis DAOM 181602=DAOM 197198]